MGESGNLKTDTQTQLLALKNMLEAKIKAGILYSLCSADRSQPHYSSGAIWAFQVMLDYVDEAYAKTLLGDVSQTLETASDRANIRWHRSIRSECPSETEEGHFSDRSSVGDKSEHHAIE